MLDEDTQKTYEFLIHYYSQVYDPSEMMLDHVDFSNHNGKTKDEFMYDFNVMPLPYLGNLLDAKFYLLMLNPTPNHVVWNDDFDLQFVAETNLSQKDRKFYPLMIDECPGHKRWTTFFRPLVNELPSLNWDPYWWLSDKVCMCNLIPFASSHFKDKDDIFKMSVFVKLREVVQELAKDEEKCFLVARRPEVWGLKEAKNVKVLNGIERRGVHLHKHVDWIKEYLI